MISTYLADFHNKEDVMKMNYTYLGKTDMKVSHLGFGGSAIGGHHFSVDENEAIAVVHGALKRGINYIDTAPWYGFGVAETVLGKALKSVPRQAYYLATKVGRYEPACERMFNFTAEKTLQSVDESLQKLGCEYLDLIQVHDLEFAPNLDMIINETLPALQKVKDAGKARYIGVTGYPLDTLKKIVERSRIPIDTILSYCRCCLHDTALLDYVPFFEERGIGIIDAAGVGMGLYTKNPLPEWHPAGSEIRQACQNALCCCQASGVDLTNLAVHYNLVQKGPSVHLISCAQMDVLERNLAVCLNGLNPLEEKILQEIHSKFFQPLKVRNWEGIELSKYWAKMTEKKMI